MKPKCMYPNTQSATTAVHRWIKRSGVPLELTARPWNRFEPLNTEWWLIPSTEWPAYRHGKFFFKTRNKDRDLYCGLFVEKGLDPSIAVAFPTGKRLVMDNTWTWHRSPIYPRVGIYQNWPRPFGRYPIWNGRGSIFTWV